MQSSSRAKGDILDRSTTRSADQFASILGLWSAGRGPLYAQLAQGIERLIEAGVLRHGELLPPERQLASALQVARGTVVSAYTRLADREVVERTRGSGTRVVAGEPLAVDTSRRVGDPLFGSAPAAIDLLVATPRLLPRTLERIQAVRLDEHHLELDDTEPAGLPVLRTRIAERYTATGLPTTAAQILVTAGAQHAMLLATMLLVRPGEVVLCEETTWPGLIDNVTRFGGRTHPLPMDDRGLVVDELAGTIERLRPVCITVNPHHHNPTGTRLSAERRRALAELASAYSVPLVEDRVVTDLAFDGQVPRPLAAEVEGDRLRSHHLTVDSVSKTAWPGLRIGWLRAEAPVIAELRARRALTDLFSPVASQLAAVAVLDDLDAIVAERTADLRARADLVADRLQEDLPDWRFARARGGLVLWIELPEGSASAFCEHAARHGVLVANGRQFGATVDDRHLRIPYTASPAELTEGIDRLASAWAGFDRQASPSPAAPTII